VKETIYICRFLPASLQTLLETEVWIEYTGLSVTHSQAASNMLRRDVHAPQMWPKCQRPLSNGIYPVRSWTPRMGFFATDGDRQRAL